MFLPFLWSEKQELCLFMKGSKGVPSIHERLKLEATVRLSYNVAYCTNPVWTFVSASIRKSEHNCIYEILCSFYPVWSQCLLGDRALSLSGRELHLIGGCHCPQALELRRSVLSIAQRLRKRFPVFFSFLFLASPLCSQVANTFFFLSQLKNTAKGNIFTNISQRKCLHKMAECKRLFSFQISFH